MHFSKPYPLLVCAGLSALWLAACAETPPDVAAADESFYTLTTPSRAGIGKVYMGREIARVMSHEGAGWLERSTRLREERTDLLLQVLPIEADSVIADLGAGSGYFTLPMARRAPEGQVYAVDIQPEMLTLLEDRAAAASLSNVVPVLATETDPGLPENSVDIALLVDAYHEFAYPREVMQRVLASLRPEGRVFLVEYRAEDPSVPIIPLHKMTAQQARLELEAIGFVWQQTLDFLPQQHVLVFNRPAP